MPESVVIDASIIVAIASKEIATHSAAQAAIEIYAEGGVEFFAPGVVVAEVSFALCQKRVSGTLTESEHAEAIESSLDLIGNISISNIESDTSLLKRSIGIRKNYGCSRSSDSLYLALAESLAKARTVELLTLDSGMVNQAKANAPGVTVIVL